jgi:hypothetical protein
MNSPLNSVLNSTGGQKPGFHPPGMKQLLSPNIAQVAAEDGEGSAWDFLSQM